MKLSVTSAMAVLAIQASSVVAAPLVARAANSLFFQSPFSKNTEQSILGKPISGDSPIELCEVDVPKLLTIEHINLSPNPPAKGQNLTIEATGILATDVEEGAYINVEVTYGYIRLLTQTFDLCEQLEQVDMKCPLKKGPISFNKQVELPSEIPPGQYVAVAKAYTKDDKALTCLETKVSFSVSFGSWFELGKNSEEEEYN